MKTVFEPERIRSYISEYRLEAIFAKPDALPLQLRVYAGGELVLKEGDPLDGLYFQVSGRTKVSSSVGTGKSLLLRFCHPLSVFGDIELLQKVVVQSEVEAVRETAFLYVRLQAVETALMQDPPFLNALLRHLSYKLQTCTTASRINLLATVEERLASYLLTTRMQNEFGREIQTTHTQEIASLIGTTPRHLNRVIRKLADRNILGKGRNALVVLDWERLDALSNGLRYD
ncbi:Crp/Fnr family transcriptional regulator [Cohnella nanjingensis]|uniref:Crp/Fnr family transcriptional regulator n=1 Tax=Cohnella nanjingensis TaxID=1387779 RepID=A0A7X0RL71_9BACL|nr:Crp/Fnr family transcriptional regulator [Cohnella nanjingensis]MBB6669528.1 Crp/Fnr family transcriptional regulator [Cohnella nanjingensis]